MKTECHVCLTHIVMSCLWKSWIQSNTALGQSCADGIPIPAKFQFNFNHDNLKGWLTIAHSPFRMFFYDGFSINMKYNLFCDMAHCVLYTHINQTIKAAKQDYNWGTAGG